MKALKDSAASLPYALDELETVLRMRLSGRRLVFEAGFDEALRPALTSALGRAIEALGPKSKSELAKQFPALTVVAIVADAVFAYDGGELWPNLAVPDRSPPMLGPAFSAAIASLGLEQFPSFDEQHAQRHVARVLAHGGIPHRSLPRFFQFLDETLGEADADPASCLELIRYSPRYRTTIPQPVRRFLAETGAVGVDLLTRTIELFEESEETGDIVDSADERGLPRHLVSGFKNHRSVSNGRTSAQRLGLRPVLRYEGVYGEGPFLLLPPVPQRVPDSSVWNIFFDGAVGDGSATRVRKPARRDVPTEVEAPPASLWRLELTGPAGEALFSRTVPGLRDQDVLVFDARNGELVRDARFSPAIVHVLSRCDLEAEGTGVSIVRRLVGPEAAAWSGWCGYEVALTGPGAVRGVFLGDAVRVPLALQVQMPLVLEDGIARVTTDDGLPVHSRTPEILSLPWTVDTGAGIWTVQARINGTQHAIGGRTSDTIQGELDRLLAADRIADIRLTCRASLGESTTARFVVVPGLECEVPPELMTPDQPPVRCAMAASRGLTLKGESGDVIDAVELGCGQTASAVVVEDESRTRVVLRLAPNLLRWRVVSEARVQGPLGSSPAFIGVADRSELERMQVQLLASGEVEAPELVLRRGDLVLATVAVRPTRRSQGGHSAGLGPLRKAIEQDAGTSFELCLRLGLRLVVIAVLQEVAAVALSSGYFEENSERVYFVGALGSTKPLRGRRMRFACIDRPWREPFDVAVPDVPTDTCRIDLTDRVGRGRYSVTAGIEDGTGQTLWYHAERPLMLDVPPVSAATTGTPDARDIVLDAVTDGRSPILPDSAHQKGAEAIGILLCEQSLSLEAEALVAPMVSQLDADWHRVISELHSRLGATPAALTRAFMRLVRIAPQTLTHTEVPIAPMIAPAASLFWLLAQSEAVRRELADTFLEELGVRAVLQPDDLIGGEPRMPTPEQRADYRALCRWTLALLSANGRARAVFSPLELPDGATLIPEWTRRYSRLLELTEAVAPHAPLRGLAARLRSARKGLEPRMLIRPFHVITMAAAYHVWVGTTAARDAEDCLIELTEHLPHYCACRVAGVGALALMAEV
jgi:hypothetical protein